MFFKISLFVLEPLVEAGGLFLNISFSLWVLFVNLLQCVQREQKFRISSLWASFEPWMWLHWLDIDWTCIKCLF